MRNPRIGLQHRTSREDRWHGFRLPIRRALEPSREEAPSHAASRCATMAVAACRPPPVKGAAGAVRRNRPSPDLSLPGPALFVDTARETIFLPARSADRSTRSTSQSGARARTQRANTGARIYPVPVHGPTDPSHGVAA